MTEYTKYRVGGNVLNYHSIIFLFSSIWSKYSSKCFTTYIFFEFDKEMLVYKMKPKIKKSLVKEKNRDPNKEGKCMYVSLESEA